MRFYKVSEFASLIGVSTSTLRIWDEQGILKPHHRSPTGYRYYSDEQVRRYISDGIGRVYDSEGGDSQ